MRRGGMAVRCKCGIDDLATVIEGARVEQIHEAHVVAVEEQAGMTNTKRLGQDSSRRRGYRGDRLSAS